MYFCIAWSFLTYKPPLHFSKQALIVESKRVHKKTASFLVTFHLVDIFHWWEAPPLEKNGISHQSNSTNVRNFKNLDRFWSTLFPFGDDFMMWLLLLYVTFLIVIWIWRQLWALCRNALHLSRLGRFLLLVELHWFVCQKHTGVFHLKHDNATRIKAFDLNRECLGVHVYTVPSEEYLKEK